jgi:hypothetical protein
MPHGRGEFGVPRRQGRLADEPAERRERMRRRHRGLVGLYRSKPVACRLTCRFVELFMRLCSTR